MNINSDDRRKKVLRNILGIIAGAALCNFGFVALALGLAQLWPAYSGHVQVYREQNLFMFPPLMAASTVLLWMIAAFAAGFAAMKIAHHWFAVLVLAALVVGDTVRIHVILRWADFPWWYNVALVVLFGPSILLGAWRARTC
jgi:UPF0716 family protein affecting phage T7 exclusion